MRLFYNEHLRPTPECIDGIRLRLRTRTHVRVRRRNGNGLKIESTKAGTDGNGFVSKMVVRKRNWYGSFLKKGCGYGKFDGISA